MLQFYKKQFLLIVLLLSTVFFTRLTAEVTELSDKSTISLLTTSPTSASVISMFGHTAIRVNDPSTGMDYTFNYGVFDDSSSGIGLLLSVFQNKLKSELWVMPYEQFFITAQKEERSLTEHILNLTPEEKKELWHGLIENSREENRGYVFDFITRNCTTFPRDLIKAGLSGNIQLKEQGDRPTYREIFTKYSSIYPWTHFLMDLIAGTNLDKIPVSDKQLYIPGELENAWKEAVIKSANGEVRPVFSASVRHLEASEVVQAGNAGGSSLLTPVATAIGLLLVMVVIFGIEWKRKVHFAIADNLVFGIVGLAGLMLYGYKLGFPSWYVQHDWMMLLLHPLHLIVPVAYIFKLKLADKLAVYHWFTMAILVFLAAGHFFLPQHFNAALLPLMGCVFVRSFSYVLLKR